MILLQSLHHTRCILCSYAPGANLIPSVYFQDSSCLCSCQASQQLCASWVCSMAMGVWFSKGATCSPCWNSRMHLAQCTVMRDTRTFWESEGFLIFWQSSLLGQNAVECMGGDISGFFPVNSGVKQGYHQVSWGIGYCGFFPPLCSASQSQHLSLPLIF